MKSLQQLSAERVELLAAKAAHEKTFPGLGTSDRDLPGLVDKFYKEVARLGMEYIKNLEATIALEDKLYDEE